MARERYMRVNLDIDATRKRWSSDPTFAKVCVALAESVLALQRAMGARNS